MPHIRFQRRALALVAGTLLLAAPLTACGFNNATDEIYNPSAGVDHRTGPLDVLSAVIVSDQEGSGTFVATFSNNSVDEPDRVTAITAGIDDPTVKVVGFKPIEVAPTGYVNLADDPGIAITGTFTAGQYVALKIDFDSADTIEMNIPVVAATYQYEGLDTSVAAIASASPSAQPTDSGSSPTQ
jgi:hypothetical protein